MRQTGRQKSDGGQTVLQQDLRFHLQAFIVGAGQRRSSLSLSSFMICAWLMA